MANSHSSPLPFTIHGYDHIKCALKDLERFERVLKLFGFSSIQNAPTSFESPTSIWASGEAVFVLYRHDHPLAKTHWDLHGDTIFDLAFVVETHREHPMLYEGAGKMKHSLFQKRTFTAAPAPRGILKFDHNTINVEKGEMDRWVEFYLKNFGFEKGQYFKIKGATTGLFSWVTRTPNKTVQIPFNEAADEKSQIQEYINVHKGAGVQHIALLSPNIIQTMEAVRNEVSGRAVTNEASKLVEFLDIPDTYYELLQKRMKIREPIKDLERLRILADSDEKGGYLLQIFTNTLFGAFFFELIQREGNDGFGEGNFTALFESMELDQKRRGVL